MTTGGQYQEDRSGWHSFKDVYFRQIFPKLLQCRGGLPSEYPLVNEEGKRKQHEASIRTLAPHLMHALPSSLNLWNSRLDGGQRG